MFSETNTRSIVKSLVWRLVVFIVDFTIVYLFLESSEWAIKLALTKMVVSLFLYYTHERVWNKVSWGRKN